MNLCIVFRGLRHRKKGMMKKMDIEMLKREWVSPARNKSALQAEIWDRAAENFADRPLPEFETDPFLKLVSRTVPLHRGLSGPPDRHPVGCHGADPAGRRPSIRQRPADRQQLPGIGPGGH